MRNVLFLLTLAASGSALAQVAEFGVHGGVSKLNNSELGSPETGLELEDGWRIGFSLTLNTWRFAGHEFGYAYNRSGLNFVGAGTQGMAIHQGFYNFLLYATPEGSRVRPFVTGGGHFSNFVPPGSSATQGGGDTNFGFNYGGGIKVRVTDTWMFRVDYRDYNTGKPFNLPGSDGRLRQMQLSAGVSFTM